MQKNKNTNNPPNYHDLRKKQQVKIAELTTGKQPEEIEFSCEKVLSFLFSMLRPATRDATNIFSNSYFRR